MTNKLLRRVVAGLALFAALLYLGRNELLAQAVMKRTPLIAEVALAVGADPNALYSNEVPLLVLLLLTPHPKNPELTTLLLDHGAMVDAEWTRNRETALFSALNAGNENVVEILLSRGANPNHRDFLGSPPLLEICQGSGPRVLSIIRTLVEYGADLALVSSDGKSCLDMAVAETPGIEKWGRTNRDIIEFIESELARRKTPGSAGAPKNSGVAH